MHAVDDEEGAPSSVHQCRVSLVWRNDYCVTSDGRDRIKMLKLVYEDRSAICRNKVVGAFSAKTDEIVFVVPPCVLRDFKHQQNKYSDWM